MRRSLRSEAGFTLPELMISIVILGIIMSALATALIVGLRNDQATTRRLNESHDAQLVSIYLPSDIKGATQPVDTSGAANACSGAGSTFAVFRGAETLAGTTKNYTASYRITQQNGEWQLVRHQCGGPSPSNLVMAHNLQENCASPACSVTTSGERITMKLTEASGYTYSVGGFRRKYP